MAELPKCPNDGFTTTSHCPGGTGICLICVAALKHNLPGIQGDLWRAFVDAAWESIRVPSKGAGEDKGQGDLASHCSPDLYGCRGSLHNIRCPAHVPPPVDPPADADRANVNSLIAQPHATSTPPMGPPDDADALMDAWFMAQEASDKCVLRRDGMCQTHHRIYSECDKELTDARAALRSRIQPAPALDVDEPVSAGSYRVAIGRVLGQDQCDAIRKLAAEEEALWRNSLAAKYARERAVLAQSPSSPAVVPPTQQEADDLAAAYSKEIPPTHHVLHPRCADAVDVYVGIGCSGDKDLVVQDSINRRISFNDVEKLKAEIAKWEKMNGAVAVPPPENKDVEADKYCPMCGGRMITGHDFGWCQDLGCEMRMVKLRRESRDALRAALSRPTITAEALWHQLTKHRPAEARMYVVEVSFEAVSAALASLSGKSPGGA